MVDSVFLLLLPALLSGNVPRIESGVVLMPGETLVAPAGPVAPSPPPPAPAPRPVKPSPRAPQYSTEEVRRESYARSSRSVCINCGVVADIIEGASHWEVQVRFDDGSRDTLRYYDRPRLRVGDAVHLEDGRLIRE